GLPHASVKCFTASPPQLARTISLGRFWAAAGAEARPAPRPRRATPRRNVRRSSRPRAARSAASCTASRMKSWSTADLLTSHGWALVAPHAVGLGRRRQRDESAGRVCGKAAAATSAPLDGGAGMTDESGLVRSLSDASAELILWGGRIYTVDAEDRIAEGVAIKEGRIVGVGRSHESRALAGPDTPQGDRGGRGAGPASADGHPVMEGRGRRLPGPSFDEARSIDEVLAVLKREAARRPPGEWILCNPLAEEPEAFRLPGSLREGRWPTRHDLDAVTPQHPVF